MLSFQGPSSKLGKGRGASGVSSMISCIVCEVLPVDDLANKLWSARHALRQPYIDAWDALDAVEEQLPDWARHPGKLGVRGSEFHERVREYVNRAYERAIEEEKLGIPALEAVRDAISEQRETIQAEIEALEPVSANAVAARIVLEAANMCFFDGGFFDQQAYAEATLRFLRPSLTGLIRAHVDEVLDNPDLPAGMLQATSPQRAEYGDEEADDD